MILSMWWEAYQWTSCCGCMAWYIDGLSVLSCATNPIQSIQSVLAHDAKTNLVHHTGPLAVLHQPVSRMVRN